MIFYFFKFYFPFLFIFFRLNAEHSEHITAVNTIQLVKKQLEASQEALAVSRANLLNSNENYEKRIIDIVKNEDKNEKNMKNIVDDLKTALEGSKSALSVQLAATNFAEKNNLKIHSDLLVLKNQNDDLININKNNEILKIQFISLKNEIIELNDKIQNQIKDIVGRDDKIQQQIIVIDEIKRLFESEKNENLQKEQMLVALHRSSDLELESRIRTHRQAMIVKEHDYEFNLESAKRILQQQIIDHENETKQLLWVEKQEKEEAIMINDKLCHDEINKLKIQYEKELNDIKNLNEKNIIELNDNFEKNLSDSRKKSEVHLETLQKEFFGTQEKEKNQKELELKFLTEIIEEKNNLLATERLQYEQTIKEYQNKIDFSEEKLFIFQSEREKQLELRSQFCDEKLVHDYEDLVREKEILEQKFMVSVKDGQTLGYVNSEICKAYVTCCDVMKEWDESMSVLVEGVRSTSSSGNGIGNGSGSSGSNHNNGSNNGSSGYSYSATQIIEESMGRTSTNNNYRDPGSTFQDRPLVFNNSYHTPGPGTFPGPGPGPGRGLGPFVQSSGTNTNGGLYTTTTTTESKLLVFRCLYFFTCTFLYALLLIVFLSSCFK